MEYRFGDLRLYFNELYLQCASLNGEFGKYFDHVIKLMNDDGIECSVRNAPIKSLDRCFEKTETDYHHKIWPTSAHLLDMNRCSITVPNANDALRVYHFLIQLSQTQQLFSQSDIQILQIVRLKNGSVSVSLCVCVSLSLLLLFCKLL